MKTIGLTLALLAALAVPASAPARHLSPGGFKNVAKYCKAVRGEMGANAFGRAFGSNGSRSNAFGKCVSQKGVLETTETPPLGGCPLEPPLPVTAFADEVCVEPPLPVFAFGAPDAAGEPDGDGGGKGSSKREKH
jgi:hypothetical protein